MNTMNMPGFTAEASFYKTSANFRSLSRSQRAILASLVPTVRMAKLNGEEEPGVYGEKCRPCSISGWQWCEKTLDGQSLDLKPYKRKCAPGGGGSISKFAKCLDEYLDCTDDCLIPFPFNLACEIGCNIAFDNCID
jgi:hypothetical protein